MVAAFLKCYLACTSSHDVLCRQSQVVFPRVHTYLSCLSLFNLLSSGQPENLLDVCCCQGTDFRVQVLYLVLQQQQYVQRHSVLLKTSWHKGCMESHPATESPGKYKIASRGLQVLLRPRHPSWQKTRWGTHSFLPFWDQPVSIYMAGWQAPKHRQKELLEQKSRHLPHLQSQISSSDRLQGQFTSL